MIRDSRIHFLIWDDVRPTYHALGCSDPLDLNRDGHGFQDPAQGFALARDDCNSCTSNGEFPKTWYYGRLSRRRRGHQVGPIVYTFIKRELRERGLV